MVTEDINPVSIDIDAFSVEEIVKIMNDEDTLVVQAVRDARDSICQAIYSAIDCIKSGGSLLYIGAGTSGRLGILDASEMPPTFNVPSHLVRAIIAGGNEAVTAAIEGAEDDEDAAKRAIADIRDKDMLLGITASGKTPFVISALNEAKRIGARCWLLTCNDVNYPFLDGIIKVLVGPEIIAGSTRLKAGTATKMVLNMISTTAMIKLGKVYKGYMVDVVPSNKKLVDRALRIIQDVTGCSGQEAKRLLIESNYNAKTAILMHMKKLSYEEARQVLEKYDGSLRKAIKC